MAFSHFFQESESMAESQGYRKNWGFLGGYRPVLALSLSRGRVPPLTSVWPDSRAYSVTNGVFQFKDAHTKGVTCFKGTLTEGDNTQLHLSPSQPSLAKSCSALWVQVFQICQSRNLGGSSSAFSSCVPTSFWALGSSSRK